MVVGGSAGASPRVAQLLAQDLNDAQVLALCEQIISYYKKLDTKKRIGKIISDLGIDAFKNELGL